MPIRTGGFLLAQALSNHQVRDVFTLHGGHLDAFFTAAGEHGIQLLDTRHEASAGHAADGYARVTGKPGVCMVTSGPGFLNSLTAIGNAYLDRTPMLVLVGAPPLRESETNELQGGFDQTDMAKSVTKWTHTLTNVERTPEVIDLALRKATSGPPGPVMIELPIDALFDEVDDARVRFPKPPAIDRAPAASADAVAATARALQQASRPVIVAGGGITYSGAEESLRALVAKTDVPVVTPNKSQGAIASDDPHFAGGTATLAALAMASQAPDVVLFLGQRTGMLTGGRALSFPDAQVIQVDLDEAEIGRIWDAGLGIVADCRTFIDQLCAAVAPCGDRSAWLQTVAGARDAHKQAYTDTATASGRIHPYHAARAVVEASPNDTTFVLDGAENALWASHHVKAQHVGDVLRLGYLGCLGVGPGFALGARVARPHAPVVLITGDGAAGFNLAEFDTMVRHHLPIVTVVFNNHCWAMSVHGQRAAQGDQGVVVSQLADSNYHEVCTALGGYGERVARLEDIPAAMQRAFDSGLPACLNLEIDPEVIHPGTLSMLGKVDDPDQIVIPYYENMPRSN